MESFIGSYTDTVRARYLRLHGDDDLCEDARFVGTDFLRFEQRVTRLLGERCDGCVPSGCLDCALAMQTAVLYGTVGEHLHAGRLADALDLLDAHARFCVCWLDDKRPEDVPYPVCAQTLYNAAQLTVNLAILYEPFLPKTARKLRAAYGFGKAWQFSSIPAGTRIMPPPAAT